MSDLFICYSKHNRKLARKIVARLESKDQSCWISPRDIEGGEDAHEASMDALYESGALLYLYTQSSRTNSDVAEFVAAAKEWEVPIIAFNLENISLSTSDINEVEARKWIDLEDDNLENSIDEVVAATQEIMAENPDRARNDENEDGFKLNLSKNNLYLIGAAIVIIAIAGIYYMLSSTNDHAHDEVLVGQWQLVNYEDDMERNDSLQAQFEQSIQGHKQMRLMFKEDGTYMRSLGSESEIGEWEISRDRRALITKPNNAPEKMLSLKELTENKMVIKIIDKELGITTLMTWQKTP